MAGEKGILRISKKGRVQIEFVSKKGKPVKASPTQCEVSQTVRDKLKELDGQEVEFDMVGGQPKQIREVGGSFVAPVRSGGSSTGDRRRKSQRSPGQPSRQHRGSGQAGGGRQRHFHNPYNFVPASPRRPDDPDLGDHRPVGQDRFDPDRYTGRITVRMVAETPLLVPDTEQVQESANGHKTFPLRVDPDGKPAIPASSVRGMLRSAYEAVTNSRFGTFSGEHRKPFQYRQTKKPYRKVDFEVSPSDLLPESLRPADNLDQLSPADRVFGWVRGERARRGEGAVRGLLRVGPVTCTSAVEEAVETFPAPGVPLAILSTPKPQQGRFYVANDDSGKAQRDGLSNKEAGYSRGKGLRGRKVYPHQGLPSEHWRDPMEDRTQVVAGSPPRYQEYRQPVKEGVEQRDDQNRSILGWVKPGAEFTFDLHVHNLSKVELGALICLLSLPEGHFHRFGGGKPLGFGSARLEIEAFDVRTGAELRERYSAWAAGPGGADPREGALRAFRKAVARSCGQFEELSFIRAFLAACKGHAGNLPTHYPPKTASPARRTPRVSPSGGSSRTRRTVGTHCATSPTTRGSR